VKPIFFDEIEPGHRFVSSRRTLTETDIVWFSGISGDYSPLHTDEVFIATETEFRGRIAQGWLTVAIASGLRSEIARWQILAYLEVDCRWRSPAYPGDTLHAEFEVTEVRPSGSRPDRGVVKLDSQVLNQDGDAVMLCTEAFMVARRDASGV
jgi:3-hydroxybutyryl-CoA dehydratase